MEKSGMCGIRLIVKEQHMDFGKTPTGQEPDFQQMDFLEKSMTRTGP